MPDRHELALRAVLRCLRPLVRMLVREGVTYPALASALKGVFVEAANDELRRQDMKQTASALSLLSGVHRKDLRDMAAPSSSRGRGGALGGRMNLIGQIVARWMAGRGWQKDGKPRRLPRSGRARSFEALVASVSQDVRPRAVLDEMLRLGVVDETSEGVSLVASGFAPRHGFDAMSQALAVNLHDHAAAAVANLHEQHNFLDQAIYVDEITSTSAAQLRRAAAEAWKLALASVVPLAEARCADDARDVDPAMRRQRLRFGVYLYEDRMDEQDEDTDEQA